MNNKFAAIDIGSNSSLLLILKLRDDGAAYVVLDTKVSTKLSAGTQYGDAMTEAALARQFTALDKFAKILEEQQVESVIACGTQVFRNANNGSQVADVISKRYGWQMDIISGEREAELSFRAATTGLTDIREARIVLDVGGGSSEVIFGQREKIIQSRSFPVGAVSLTERFSLEGETISSQNLEQARQYLHALFSANNTFQTESTPRADDLAVNEDLTERRDVVAVGGTAATLAALNLEQKIFDPRTIHGVRLTETWIADKITCLSRLGIAQRRNLMPYDPDRAEIIVAGALIISVLLDRLGATRLIVSNCGLRWGLITSGFSQLQHARIEQ